MPGVLQIEALAQTAAPILMLMDEYKGKLTLFAGVDGAKFKNNTAAHGGAIYTEGDLEVDGATFIENVADVDGGIYNVGSGGTTLEERVRGIVEVFCPADRKSEITYRPEKQNCTQFVLDIQKTVFELGYEPKYSWKDYLVKFKEEMEMQPFAKIWGVESDYYKLEE